MPAQWHALVTRRQKTARPVHRAADDLRVNRSLTIPADELEWRFTGSGGPGGQHQNKTESGVRYTHLPTGIAAESRSERSQHKNDQMALSLLKAKLYRIEEQKRLAIKSRSQENDRP